VAHHPEALPPELQEQFEVAHHPEALPPELQEELTVIDEAAVSSSKAGHSPAQ
jgi:hypothetical protein